MRPNRLFKRLVLFTSFSLGSAIAQTSPDSVRPILEQQIQPPSVTAFQLSQYLAARIPRLPSPSSAAQWTAEAKRLRRHLLEDIAFHGWPRDWVEAPPKFEDLGLMGSGKGYRMRKLRYEIVPGLQSTAILYEPENISGKIPAVLNVNGHAHLGKAEEYKQKICINFARRGIFALNLEWLGFGELGQAENSHDFGGHLDLVGANELGLFYLAMRRGLDYLASYPQVDRSRLGITGLSGGGWQTIVLGALDERVVAAAEVAGFGSLESNIARPTDTDEVEEDATDLIDGQDYTHLAAMRAPRPTLLIHNAEDDCCFRASLVKPTIYEDVKPFFKLSGKEDAFTWHENVDPATHNYQLDNRQQAYRFFTQHFNLPVAGDEITVDAEVKTYEELAVGLPKDNLTILGLAKKLAGEFKREPMPTEAAAKSAWAASERTKLKNLIRSKPVTIKHAWRMANTKNKGLETVSYRFDFDNGLSAAGVWLKAIAAPDNAPATIILNDNGRKAAGEPVSDRVNRGEQVLGLDLLFVGDSATEKPGSATYAMKLASIGDRPMGIEVAQLVGAANWLRAVSGNGQIRLESNGIRSQVTALVGAALEPSMFSEVVNREAMRSLSYLLDAPVAFRSAPDLFCLDLYKEFDLDRLAALAEPTKLTMKYLGQTSK